MVTLTTTTFLLQGRRRHGPPRCGGRRRRRRHHAGCHETLSKSFDGYVNILTQCHINWLDVRLVVSLSRCFEEVLTLVFWELERCAIRRRRRRRRRRVPIHHETTTSTNLLRRWEASAGKINTCPHHWNSVIMSHTNGVWLETSLHVDACGEVHGLMRCVLLWGFVAVGGLFICLSNLWAFLFPCRRITYCTSFPSCRLYGT